MLAVLVQEASNVSSNSEPLERPRRGFEATNDGVVVLALVVGILMKVATEKIAQIGEAIHVHAALFEALSAYRGRARSAERLASPGIPQGRDQDVMMRSSRRRLLGAFRSLC